MTMEAYPTTSIKDIWQMLGRQKKLFWGVVVLFIILGVAVFIRSQSDRLLTVYLRPASYLSINTQTTDANGNPIPLQQSKLVFLEELGQTTSVLNTILIPRLQSEKNSKLVGLEANLENAAGTDTKAVLNSIKLVQPIHTNQLAQIKPAYVELLKLLQTHQKDFVTAQQHLFTARLAVLNDTISSNLALVQKLQQQVPVIDTLLKREYPMEQAGTKGNKVNINNVSASLFSMLQSASAAETLSIQNKSNQQINTLRQSISSEKQQVLALKREQSSLKNADFVSEYILAPAKIAPALKLIIAIMIGFILAFLLAFLVDSVRND